MSAILMYHYIAQESVGGEHAGLTVPLREFVDQLALLRSMGRRSISPEEFDAALGTRQIEDAVWLTFDDGKLDNYTLAFPALKNARMRATFFLIADRTLNDAEGYVSRAQVREMLAAGMDIGCHSASHPKLARCSAEELRREVHDTKRRLEDEFQRPITSFCYPYGNWNADVVREVEAAGYRIATSTIRDNRNVADDRFLLKRAMVQPGRTGLSFRYMMSPLYHFVHARKNQKRWK